MRQHPVQWTGDGKLTMAVVSAFSENPEILGHVHFGVHLSEHLCKRVRLRIFHPNGLKY
jgi:hypothetical protein